MEKLRRKDGRSLASIPTDDYHSRNDLLNIITNDCLWSGQAVPSGPAPFVSVVKSLQNLIDSHLHCKTCWKQLHYIQRMVADFKHPKKLRCVVCYRLISASQDGSLRSHKIPSKRRWCSGVTLVGEIP